MNGVDLNQFQFDYDQTWAVLIFRHDGTLLARYGTRGDKDGMTYNSMRGFQYTLRSALEADKRWSPELALHYKDKIGPPAKHKTAEEIPAETITRIQGRKKNTRESCVHCHNIYDARRDFALSQGEYDPWQRFKYPLPQNIGLTVNESTEILAVEPDSPATNHFVPGEIIRRVNGQNVHSIADIQFALHHVSEPGEVAIETVTKQGRETKATLQLPKGWRKSDISWRVSMYGMPPKPGLWVQAASAPERKKLGIAEGRLALKVRGTFGKDVRNAGLKKGDVIVQFGDETDDRSEGEFHAHLRMNYFRPNSKLPLKLIRNGETMDLTVTFPNQF